MQEHNDDQENDANERQAPADASSCWTPGSAGRKRDRPHRSPSETVRPSSCLVDIRTETWVASDQHCSVPRSTSTRSRSTEASLHRFRYAVATALVEDGKILKAQARLGHRDDSPPLRACRHRPQLRVADELDRRLNEAAS